MDMEDESEINLDIDELFKDPSDDNEDEGADNNEQSDESQDNQMTEAVTKRINTVKKKTEQETQDKIAKELGYDNYADLQKANEKKMLRDAGLDEQDIESVVEKLVAKRLADDPRMKKLEEYESREKTNFVSAQLKEINKLTGSNYTSVEQLPKDTLEVWEKTGNLKQAYLATQGEALLTKRESTKMNGSTNHLAGASGGGTSIKQRPLNDEEKAIYRSVMPDITEEELSKLKVNFE